MGFYCKMRLSGTVVARKLMNSLEKEYNFPSDLDLLDKTFSVYFAKTLSFLQLCMCFILLQ